MAFMGMMSVLPSTITHPAPKKENNLLPWIQAKLEAVLNAVREFRKSWTPEGIEVRRPRYR
jgi:hypothetical protein